MIRWMVGGGLCFVVDIIFDGSSVFWREVVLGV